MKKQLERLTYMSFGVLIAVVGYFFGTLQSDHVDAQIDPANVEYNKISCRSLTVVDEDGKARIVLGAGNHASVIGILDENGKPRIHFLMDDTNNSGAISISDENGKTRIFLRTHPDGPPGISISDENGKARILLATPDEEGVIGISDENGKPRVGLRTLDGVGVISIADENQKSRILLHGDTDGKAFIGIADENGNMVKLLD